MSKEIFDNQGNKIGEIRDKKSSTGGGGWLLLLMSAGIAHLITAGDKPAFLGVCFFASKKYNINLHSLRIFVLLFLLFSGVILGVAVYYYFYYKWKDEIKKSNHLN